MTDVFDRVSILEPAAELDVWRARKELAKHPIYDLLPTDSAAVAISALGVVAGALREPGIQRELGKHAQDPAEYADYVDALSKACFFKGVEVSGVEIDETIAVLPASLLPLLTEVIDDRVMWEEAVSG